MSTTLPTQYYSETNEADAWMNEEAGIASSQDYGKDEDAATKALTKHKVCILYVLHNRLTQSTDLLFTCYTHNILYVTFIMYVY